MDQFLPAGGLLPGAEIWADLNFKGSISSANGVDPYGSCITVYGFFTGYDLVFREPSGDCSPGGNCDWQGGIRSAKLGPFIDVPFGTQAFLPAGVGGCAPTAPATTCPSTCNATTCKAEWEWLVNHAANYPTLRCERPGILGTENTLIDCSQAQSTDIVNKNWFIDSGE